MLQRVKDFFKKSYNFFFMPSNDEYYTLRGILTAPLKLIVLHLVERYNLKFLSNTLFWLLGGVDAIDPAIKPIYAKRLLFLAIQQKNLAFAKILLEAGANVELPDRHNYSPLAFCAIWGTPEIMKLLLLYGAKVNAESQDIPTALIIALEFYYHHRNEQINFCIEVLIKAGADVNAKGEPLWRAILTKNITAVKLLLAAGADVNRAFGESELTPLQNAAAVGNAEIVNLLLGYGADVNLSTRATPLLYAIVRNISKEPNLEVIEILINAGADINQPDQYGFLPIMHAVLHGDITVLPLLKKSINTRFKFGSERVTVLHLAAANQKDTAVIEVLLSLGAKLEAKVGREARTPLQRSIEHKNITAMKTLLDAGANTDTKVISYPSLLEDDDIVTYHRDLFQFALETSNVDAELLWALYDADLTTTADACKDRIQSGSEFIRPLLFACSDINRYNSSPERLREMLILDPLQPVTQKPYDLSQTIQIGIKDAFFWSGLTLFDVMTRVRSDDSAGKVNFEDISFNDVIRTKILSFLWGEGEFSKSIMGVVNSKLFNRKPKNQMM